MERRGSIYRLKGSPKEGLFGATLGFFIGFAAVALFGPTAMRFKEAIGLEPLEVGLLVAVPALSGSLLRIPFGAWVDTSGGRRPFLVLLLLSIIGMLGLTAVVHFLYPEGLHRGLFPLLLTLGVFCGCGIATFSVGISQVSYWFPQSRQGWALGTYAGIGNLAPGLFSFLLPIALNSLGLMGSYLIWLIFLLTGTILYYIYGRNCWYFQLLHQGVSVSEAKKVAREQGQELFPARSLKESLLLSAQNWKTWGLVAIYFTTFGGFIALTAWLPIYWGNFFGVTAVTAGILTAIYSLLTSIIRVVGGGISDRIGGEKTVILALLTMAAGGLLMMISRKFALSIVAEIVMAIGMGAGNAAVFKLVPRYVKEAVGGAAGWVGGLGAFGGFAIPPLMALFVSTSGKIGYSYGFVIFIALASISLLLAHVLNRAYVLQTEAPVAPFPRY